MAKRYKIQLYDLNGAIIQSTGGVCQVCTAGDAAKATITDKAGTALSNPVALSNGEAEFYTANTVNSVDIYMMAPGGQFIVRRGIQPGETGQIHIDVDQAAQMAIIPFSIDDSGTTAATEVDSGFDLPTDALVVTEGMAVDVSTLDVGETIDVGLLSTEAGGDANGFMSLIDVEFAVLVAAIPVITVGSNENFVASTTLGALVVAFLAGTDVATDVGTHFTLTHRIDGTAVSISFTLTTGTNLAEGFIKIPYIINL